MNLSLGTRACAWVGGTCAWLVSLAWLTACGTSNTSPDSPQAGATGQPSGDGGSAGALALGAGSGGAPGVSSSGTGGASSGTETTLGGATGSAGAPSSTPGSGASGAGTAGASTTGIAGSGAAGAPNPPASACTTDEERKFSFFATSQAGLQRLSGKADGFGGNLGGLAGADRICQQLAESSSPCQNTKVWRAFLSTTTEDAIDRIGKGPWHDRRGRLLANGIEDLLPTADTEKGGRPANADPEIRNDFPNEDGTPNQFPDGGTMSVDNHQFITGTGSNGRLYMQATGASGASGVGGGSGLPGRPGKGLGFNATTCRDAEGWTPEAATCWNWTSSEFKGCPRVGHSWGAFSGWDWISVWNESGCAPGGTIIQEGAGDDSRKIGSGGGYGGFYCFAVTP